VEVKWWQKDERAEDIVGRGTKWAGIIFGKHNQEGLDGVTPDCTFYAVKVTNDNQGAILDVTDVWRLSRGIIYASSPLHMNADVLCIPLNIQLKRWFCWPIELACSIARNINHCVIVTSSGTSNGDSDVMNIIAKYDTTICVGAVDSNNNRYFWSPYGEEVDVVAPGVDIYTTNLSNTYDYVSDTGAAAAFVAGTAALYFSERGIKNPTLKDVENCEEALKENAVSLVEEKESDFFGHGLIDAHLTTVYGRRVVIDFSWFPPNPVVGNQVTFTSNSYDPDGKIVIYSWDFQNDGVLDASTEKATFTYQDSKKYTCLHRVRSSDGEEAQIKKALIVSKSKSNMIYRLIFKRCFFFNRLVTGIKDF